MQLTKENLYNEIQKYIYDSAFGDLNVFSKQYYHSIVSPCYRDNSKNSPYSVISIDFNDMQKINKDGMKKGDQILHDSIELMQSVLPKDSYTIRLGGDEFLFFLNNVSKEGAIRYEKKMHGIMNNFSHKLNGTTVTSYCVSSKDSNSIDSLIDIADVAITAIKQGAKISNTLDDWNILEQKAADNFSTFFKTLRFHGYPMSIEELNKILQDVISTYDDYANQVDNTEKLEQKEENLEEEKFIYDLDNLKSLNKLFAGNLGRRFERKQIENYDISTLVAVLDSMVRDPITNQFTESYFKNFLINESHCKFKVLKISPAFVKFSNTINSSHSTTNIQMKNYQKDLYSFLNSKIDFNQDTFTTTPLNYMIALSGGDMLLATSQKDEINVDNINEYLKSKNSTEYSADNLLRYVASDSFEKINKHNYRKVLAKQTQECNDNKIPLIKEVLNDDIIKDLLSVTLQDTMEFYSNLVPDIKDISAKTKYLDLIGKTVLNLYNTLDVVHDEDLNKEDQGNKAHHKYPNFLKRISSLFRRKTLSLPAPDEVQKDNENNQTEYYTQSSIYRKDFASSLRVNNSDADYQKIVEQIKNNNKKQVENNNEYEKE